MPTPKNLLIVTFDAARADRFGCYGYARPTTPHADAFAREALVFDRMIAPSPWTVPSHASLFTGLYPREHGADYPVPILARGALTLAAHLGAHGYATALVSNNLLVGEHSGLAQGVGHILRRRQFDPWQRRRWARWAGNLLGLLDSGADAANRTIGALLPQLPEPFFLFVNYMECHWKYLPPRRFERRFSRHYSTLGSLRRRLRLRGRFSWEAEEAVDGEPPTVLSDLYDAELATVDAAFGELLRRVRGAGLEDRTVIVLLADHGEMLGEHGMTGHGMALWQPLLHVPFLARVPGMGPVRIGALLQLTDVFGGLCGLLGLPLPATLRDQPGAADPFAPGSGRPYAFAAWQQWPEARIEARRRRNPRVDFSRWPSAEAVLDGRFKLIATARGEEALFDLEADPPESRDIGETAPAVRARLRGALAEWRRTRVPRVARPAFTPEEERAITARLAELGYV